MDSAEFHASVSIERGLFNVTCMRFSNWPRFDRCIRLYDKYHLERLLAMVSLLLVKDIIIADLNLGPSGHIAKLIGMPRHSRHVGQGE